MFLMTWPVCELLPRGHCSPLRLLMGPEYQLTPYTASTVSLQNGKGKETRILGSLQGPDFAEAGASGILLFCFWAETHSSQQSHGRTLKVICFGWMRPLGSLLVSPRCLEGREAEGTGCWKQKFVLNDKIFRRV